MVRRARLKKHDLDAYKANVIDGKTFSEIGKEQGVSQMAAIKRARKVEEALNEKEMLKEFRKELWGLNKLATASVKKGLRKGHPLITNAYVNGMGGYKPTSEVEVTMTVEQINELRESNQKKTLAKLGIKVDA